MGKEKAPDALCQGRRRLSLNYLRQFFSPSSSLSVQVISRSIQRAENPMAHWFQELETDGKAVVAQALAISDTGLGAKIARKQFKR